MRFYQFSVFNFLLPGVVMIVIQVYIHTVFDTIPASVVVLSNIYFVNNFAGLIFDNLNYYFHDLCFKPPNSFS